ncbi:type 2 lanthipeptide synthetase LanM family protein [Clostridium boliviensis]|uniref:Type 2 lanthipeptide synthetase LanM family protein n=1 Tax=Clostridium boliviensis TaxID=318465 RepID=A0ABU4GJF3_9CLOT|nr:type 2 lanthipeptide synthetase LanM family protein [Clostridium boliviensis]MDW2797738.1 type 2 lanthipeptide synthetase LanM family protein [Clostridium boliviensis]
MMSIKSYYIKERKILDEKKGKEEVMDYWRKILKGVDMHIFPSVYGISFKSILFPKYTEPVFTQDMTLLSQIMILYKEYQSDPLETVTIPVDKMFFSSFYNHFLQFGVFTLKKVFSDLQPSIIKSYSRALLDKLGSVSLRTLIFEMYISKESGLLEGNPSEQYLQYNEDYLKDKNYIAELFQLYPGLERLLFESILITNKCYISFFTRLNNDWKKICNNFEIKDKNLVVESLKSDTSDSHNGGETVFILELKNRNKLVYKSRSLKAEVYLQKTIEFIKPGLKYDLGKFNILDCENYGWEEFVESDCCRSHEQLKRYYYRFGSLIFISYILNANDFHEENLIANGEYPKIIDAETILENWKASDQLYARDNINIMLRQSVLSSGLLPKKRFDKKGQGIDMSAVGGQGGTLYPFKIPHIVVEYTSNMHLEYKNPVKEERDNLARLNDLFVPAAEFSDDIVEGFSDAYTYAFANKNSLCDLLNSFGDLKVRHLIQDTQKYSMILHLSYHPDFLQDCKDRELFLCSLYKDCTSDKSEDIIKHEVDDMLHMDIPYFTVMANETMLRDGRGQCIEDYFSHTSIEYACHKVMELSEADLEKQVMFINIALDDVDKTNERNSKIKHITSNKSVLTYESECEETVKKIADYLIRKAVWGKNKKDISWVDVLPLGDDDSFSWDIRPISVYLYEGLAGIAIFFAALNKVFQCEKYEQVLNAVAESLFQYTDNLLEDRQDLNEEDSGIFNGEAGLVYTYCLLFKITNSKIYLEYAVRHVDILAAAIQNDKKFDLVYGNSGAVIALVEMYEITNDKSYLLLAQQAGDILIVSQNHNGGWTGNPKMSALAGMSHGTSGIIYALTRLWEYTQNEYTLNAIKNGLKFEQTLYDQTYKNWKDERHFKGEKISDKNIYTVAWCHGAPGILLGRIGMLSSFNDECKKIILQDIQNAIETVYENGISNNNCLCHGNIGNTEIIQEYCKKIGDIKLETDIKEIRKEIVAGIAQDECLGVSSLYGYCSIGFMNGMSGIGYSLLRDLSGELPCVLAVNMR